MPPIALTTSHRAAHEARQVLTKRENWAKQEAGVVVVFVIVGIVIIGLVGYNASKFLKRRKAARAERAAKA